MSTDAAGLILFGDVSNDLFFAEAQQQGVSLGTLQDDEEIHNHVLHGCLIKARKATAKAVAAELGIPITDDQAHSIARNSLTPEVMAEPAPLAAEERAIAKVLYFHAVKAAVARQGNSIKDRTARAEAQRMVAAGERGLTSLQRFSRASGCLAVVGVFALGAASAVLSAAAVIIAAMPTL